MLLRAVIGVLERHWGLEEYGGREAEALKIRMKQLACRELHSSLEGMPCHKRGMRMIYEAPVSHKADLHATHLKFLNHDLVWKNLFLIFFGLSADL